MLHIWGVQFQNNKHQREEQSTELGEKNHVTFISVAFVIRSCENIRLFWLSLLYVSFVVFLISSSPAFEAASFEGSVLLSGVLFVRGFLMATLRESFLWGKGSLLSGVLYVRNLLLAIKFYHYLQKVATFWGVRGLVTFEALGVSL